ncbi:hypothetical protein BDV96DRAFT_601499 [Lophiotrema nucula]|uniref:Uncharacterized protein n=1 Tax=Lophiotrema nucula TaxID=690887 RepID=A0A6A5Z1Q3_9PLEO|nr:hypothetical protein BDV96DRAFT_601499 [Lophiotrema nucula]
MPKTRTPDDELYGAPHYHLFEQEHNKLKLRLVELYQKIKGSGGLNLQADGPDHQEFKGIMMQVETLTNQYLDAEIRQCVEKARPLLVCHLDLYPPRVFIAQAILDEELKKAGKPNREDLKGKLPPAATIFHADELLEPVRRAYREARASQPAHSPVFVSRVNISGGDREFQLEIKGPIFYEYQVEPDKWITTTRAPQGWNIGSGWDNDKRTNPFMTAYWERQGYTAEQAQERSRSATPTISVQDRIVDVTDQPDQLTFELSAGSGTADDVTMDDA